MIRKLRWKFVAVCMGLVALVLSAVFGAAYHAVRQNIEDLSRQMLYQVLREDSGRGAVPNPAIEIGGDRGLLPYFTVNIWGDTAYITGDAPCPFDYPVVVKAAGGCGGRQVRLCSDEAAYRAAIREFSFQAVVQPLCDTPGRDLRVYMLGTACVQAMLRQSNSADFRSNFGLHHCAQPVEIPPEARRVACAVAEELRSALIGVDFIYDHGRLLFNEAEDAVGTRMLYQYTKLDIVRLYMDYIVAQMGE